MKTAVVFSILATVVIPVFAAQAVWQQCGGIGFSGSKVCAAGNTCVGLTDYYSQCQPALPAKVRSRARRALCRVRKPTNGAPSTNTTVTYEATTSTVLQLTTATPEATTMSVQATPTTIPTPEPTTTTVPSSSGSTTGSGSTTSGSTSPAQSSYSPASGLPALGSTTHAIGTTYGGNWPGGTCSFADYRPGALPGVALGKQQWAGAAGCGACVRITGASGSVVAMVDDQCPECVDGHLDLEEGYAQVVDGGFRTKGIFDISWEFVPCPLSSNIQFKNKEGTSKYYFAMQVRNSVLPIDKLEVSTDDGKSWANVAREEYNYFTAYGGFMADTVDVRVTAINGAQIVQKRVGVASGSVIEGSAQFSA